jgi:hypothetical protein
MQQNASIAQLGERQTEDLKALCSIHSRGIALFCIVFAGMCTTEVEACTSRAEIHTFAYGSTQFGGPIYNNVIPRKKTQKQTRVFYIG